METYTKKEREYYNGYRDRVCERLNITKNNYNWLRRKGTALHTLYEYQCNGEDNNGCGMTQHIKSWERQEDKLYKEIEKYIGALGLHVYFQTDPRGATIYLDDKEIPDNNYTQASCIY